MAKSSTTFQPGDGRKKGRPKGSQNKVSIAAKEAIEIVFDELGGVSGLKAWAQSDPQNERIFYGQIWPKVLPKEIKADVTHRGWFNVLAGLGSDNEDR